MSGMQQAFGNQRSSTRGIMRCWLARSTPEVFAADRGYLVPRGSVAARCAPVTYLVFGKPWVDERCLRMPPPSTRHTQQRAVVPRWGTPNS